MSDTANAVDPADLIDRLQADEDGSVRAAAIDRIGVKMAEIKRAVDAGVSPADYEVLNKALVALQHAKLVITVAWARYRKDKAA